MLILPAYEYMCLRVYKMKTEHFLSSSGMGIVSAFVTSLVLEFMINVTRPSVKDCVYFI
jgi:hypothetical protein